MTSVQPYPLWNSRLNQSGVSVMGIYDFSANGKSDILVGRDDSSIELQFFNINNELEITFSKQLNDKITGIDAGNISSPNFNEFILSTFSGRVVGVYEADNKFKEFSIQKSVGLSSGLSL